jgi:hypothetical protein
MGAAARFVDIINIDISISININSDRDYLLSVGGNERQLVH